MQILDGRKTSQEIKDEIKEKVTTLRSNGSKVPHLAAVLVGNDGGSVTYVNAKVKACEYVGFDSSLFSYEESISEQELLNKVEELNQDPHIDGFIVQLPLPAHIDEKKVTLAIDPSKDVDGFHPENLGRMSLGLPSFLPATPNGIIELLKRYNIDPEGKHCVVLGRSSIVGTPMSILLSRNAKGANATVTICHSRTNNLKEICLQADILIAAIGRPYFVKEDMVKEGAVVVDVGTSRIEDASKKSGFKLAGDVDFEKVAGKCSFITPVPGGVGPMTIASLLQNTFFANQRRADNQ